MAEYMNPFSGSLLPESVPNNPFLSGQNQAVNRTTMAPFLEMEKQRQQYGLQEQGMKAQEFTSPEAQAARLSTLQATTALRKFEIATHQQALENLPMEQKIKVIEMRDKLSTVQGAPQKRFLAHMAQLTGSIKDLPPEERAREYANGIVRFERENPGIPIPEHYKNYSDSNFKELEVLMGAMIATPDFITKTKLQKQKEDAEMAKQKEQSRSSLEVQKEQNKTAGVAAAITAKANKEIEQMKTERAINTPKNIAQEKIRLRKILNAPKGTVSEENRQVAEETLKSNLEDEVLKEVNARQYEIIQNQTSIDKIRQGVYERNGIRASQKSGDRVNVKHPDGRIGTIPRSQLSEALKAGFKEVK